VFRRIPYIVSYLPNPDLVHSMPIGMLDHLQKLVFQFINIHERLNQYKAILLSMPAYNDLTPSVKLYEEVCQLNRKEMKAMRRYLLGVVTQSLQGGSPPQCPIFNNAI